MNIIATNSTKKLFSGIVLILIFISCTENISNSKSHEKIILRYNELLVRGYVEMNMTPLREVATEDQVQKVYHHMAALGESGLRLESELKDIDFLEINYDGKNIAFVKTRESWDYNHFHINTKKSSKKIENFVYELTYRLTKEDGMWIIANVESIKK